MPLAHEGRSSTRSGQLVLRPPLQSACEVVRHTSKMSPRNAWFFKSVWPDFPAVTPVIYRTAPTVPHLLAKDAQKTASPAAEA